MSAHKNDSKKFNCNTLCLDVLHVSFAYYGFSTTGVMSWQINNITNDASSYFLDFTTWWGLLQNHNFNLNYYKTTSEDVINLTLDRNELKG